MITLRERAKALIEELWHEAQTDRMYDIAEQHLRKLLEDEAADLAGVEEPR